ncbi:MAG: hypothetical protein AAGG01_18185 [Planctomycetota bacterium]
MIPLALLALALPASQVQSNSLLQRLISVGDPVPGLPAGYVLSEPEAPVAGRGGGWLARVRAVHAASGSEFDVIIGQRPDEMEGPVQLLRQPQTIDGIRQDSIYFASMANGLVAYYAGTDVGGPQDRLHAWVEDEPVALAGEPIPGMPEWTWRFPARIYLTTSGAFYINGVASIPGGEWRRVVWRWPDQEILIASGQPIPGVPFISQDFWTAPEISEDGLNWSVILYAPGNRALVVNGALYEAAPGYPVMRGSAVPPQITGSHGASTWRNIGSPSAVNNRGDVLFRGTADNSAGDSLLMDVRNGRRHSDAPGSGTVAGMDARGALVYSRVAGSRLIDVEGYNNVLRNSELDLDGDGEGETGTAGTSFWHNFAGPNSRHSAVCLASFPLDSGETGQAYFRARDFRMDTPLCEGNDNSTGFPGQLIVCGSRRVSDDEVGIEMFGFPTGSTGFVLASRTPGLVANPGQSQGNLCLSGQIGRLATQAFTVGDTGRAAISFDLNSLPTPFGDVTAMPGDRWYVQAWYRDSIGGQATSNFTSASGFQFD